MPIDSTTIFEEALRVRRFEERLLEAFSRGLVRGTVHTCLGQELIPVTLNRFLSKGDFVFGTHRAHGYFLARTGDYLALAKEILGKAGGVTGGIGGTQHLISPGLITNGVQGGLVPVAVGYASALAKGHIAVCVIGDGSLGQGAVYEALNLASSRSLPLLLVIEDNGIAQSTRTNQVLAGDLRTRVEGFGVKYFESSDLSQSSLVLALEEAVRHVRTNYSPAAIKISTRRLGPHSKGDDNRPDDELAELWQEDPISKWLQSSADASDIDQDIRSFLDDVFEEAIAADAAFRLPEKRLEPKKLLLERHRRLGATGGAIRNQVSAALEMAFVDHENAEMFGEDIEVLPSGMGKPYNGAFGVSGQISSNKLDRLNNMPISEQAIVGFGIGRALAKSETIVEIMFGDFSTLIVDQVRQQASKIAGSYGAAVHLPLLIRTPMSGRRGYGPTHSQSLEGLFVGTPNILLYSVSPFGFDASLFSRFLAAGIPAIVFEYKDLYHSEPVGSLPAPYELRRPKNLAAPLIVDQTSQATTFTAVSYGSAAKWALAALGELARDYEIFGRLFVVELLQPMDARAIDESIANTQNLLLIEECQPSEGLGNSLLHSLQERGGFRLFRFGSVGGNGDIGSSKAAEEHALLSEARIVQAVLDLVEA